MRGVIYVSNSKNSKLSKSNSHRVDATYVSIKGSCPSSCVMREFCYARSGYVGITNSRLDKESNNLTPLQIAREEAKLIKQATKTLNDNTYLRLHVSGEARTLTAVKVIANAVDYWLDNGGKGCWTYTRCWKTIPRSNWKRISVLASCFMPEDIVEAENNGYAPTMVVREHESDKSYVKYNVRWIPCPAQTKHTGCVDCKLCMKADELYDEGCGIAFAAHGISKDSLKKRLYVLR